ncbi:hypothetical protein ACWV95_24715 [Streptomyces albus]
MGERGAHTEAAVGSRPALERSAREPYAFVEADESVAPTRTFSSGGAAIFAGTG